MARLPAILAALIFLAACSDEAVGPRRLSPAAENRLRGERYLRENGAKPDVIATASGLQYREITHGSGDKPKSTDVVKVHYRGATIDGREFESSRDRGTEPVLFTLGDARDPIIRGLQEGLPLMTVGSIWEFAIPSHLAYGLNGRPPKVGPNQTLIFTIELIGIVK